MKKRIIPVWMLFAASGFLSAQANPSSGENYIYTKTNLSDPSLPGTPKIAETVQYFDGLGRPSQVISVKASPSGKDLVTQIPYDPFGRQTESWLPAPMATSNGAIQSGVGGAAQTYYNDNFPFSRNNMEASPLNRVLSQVQPGSAWQQHPVGLEYEVNGGDVNKYTATYSYSTLQSSISLSGTYGENQLYKNTVTDEDGNLSIEFKDKDGQTILVRKMLNATEKADTYYVYNEYHQLAYVIPPLASVSGAVNQTTLDQLCYQYKYDERNRLMEKKLPGKGWEYMVYDRQDRLVLSQDPNLGTASNNFNAQGWMFTKYDQFGRVVYTGFFASTAGRAALQAEINNMTSNSENMEVRSSTPFTLNGMEVYYTKNAFPTTGMTVLSINYYDTYPSGAPALPTQILAQEVITDTAASGITTKSLPLASYVKNIEDNKWTKNYSSYDKRGRSIGTYSLNHLGGYTKTETELDFAGVAQKTNTFHLRKLGEIGVTVQERFVYDSQNRMLQHYHKVDDKAEVLLTENTYNELSQLKNKTVGNSLQSIDYTYNIRGWMTGINRDQMQIPDLGGKLFSYKIKYNEKEGITSPDPTQFPGKEVKAKYNGNVAEVDWRSVENIGSNPSITPKRYGYAYDKLNRLTAGFYQTPNNPGLGENTESLEYDLNGNITRLFRTSVLEYGNITPTKIDDLEYIYDAQNKSNKLITINDNSYNPTGYEGGGMLIQYDENGNMTEIPDKTMSIQYNYLNLPSVVDMIIDFPFNVEYSYRADGVKLRKKSTSTVAGYNTITTTVKDADYLDGFQYNKTTSTTNGGGGGPADPSAELMAPQARAMERQAYSVDYFIPLDPTPVMLKNDDLEFFPTAEGFYDYKKDQYIYQYKDHLGNVRVSFGRDSSGNLELVDVNDYYPFGMNHLKSGNAFFGAGSYKNYKYNGKELQEIGMYDYGARFHMPDIGRWGVVDKLSEKYSFASNYAYVLNRPTVAVDPDGKRVYFIGGAGNDPESQGWNYVNRWGNYFTQAGMNFYRVNATRGTNQDLNFTAMYRHTGYEKMSTPMYPSPMGGFGTTSYNSYNTETRPVQDDMIDATVSMYQQQLKDNPLQKGEQFNLAGYSYGSVLQAQAALRLADSGQIIDNVILIGSPISDKSDLMKQMKNNPNIKNVLRYDFSGDLLSNPNDMLDFLKGTYDSSPLGRGNDAPHLDGARPGKKADQLIQTIIQWLQEQGVKN